MTEDYLQRFGGIGRLYGSAALPRLHASRVAVIGVGGVGSWVVEALARSGVGSLTLIDMDDVCITNVNRQLPALDGMIGKPKVEVLADRVRQIAPECRCTAVTEFFLESNADRLLSAGFDGIVDAVDVTDIKALIIAKARALGIPMIISGSAGGRRDPTQVKVADLGYAGGDPLVQQVRRRLRDEHGFPKSPAGKSVHWGIPCVFSTEKAVYPQPDGTCAATRTDATETGLRLDCSAGFGAATFVTGTFGFALAAEMLRLLTGGSEAPMASAVS
ncbi:tRNA threonylcarbamoyladenosine dehydratase [Brevifollis gellanilyticus]|nr:tRNA threonylcarbamoyladenosine dehydratase [Brevifollis gellanilyticus]